MESRAVSRRSRRLSPAAATLSIAVALLAWQCSDAAKVDGWPAMALGRILLQIEHTPSLEAAPSTPSQKLTTGDGPSEKATTGDEKEVQAVPPVAGLDWTPSPSAGEVEVPLPMAFFPLDGPEMRSLLGNYSGIVQNASFDVDAAVGLTSLRCNAGNNSKVTISNVPYGKTGGWAINFWLKADGAAPGVQRIFSHTAALTQNTLPLLWGANQVKMYFPGTVTGEVSDPYAGILRAVVKDGSDIYIGEDTVTFLDSNGQVSNVARSHGTEAQRPSNLTDGRWHMVTLSTLAEGGVGFRLFIDGRQVGEMNAGILYSGTDGVRHVATGGGPLNIRSNIYLCADPAVNASGQGFSGRLLELAIWDEPLSKAAIQAFYTRHFADEPDSNNQTAKASIVAPSPSKAVDTKEKQLQTLLSFPDPKAYFPLTNGSLNSNSNYGFFTYGGRGYNISWIRDPKVGTVLSCSKAQDSTVMLDPVLYGKNGQWAISLWFKPSPTGLAGSQFEYLLSHTNRAQAYPTGWEANQVRIYFPQLGHPGYGLVRAIVKDSNDHNTQRSGQTFLDSDGLVGQLLRNGTTAELRAGGAMLQDGKWHMATLTTLPGQMGYAMYLDGILAGELNATTVSEAGLNSVDGGNPMDLDGEIFLCGRSSGDVTRGYEGLLAELSIFDSTLTASQIEALFYTGMAAPDQVPHTKPAAAPGPQPLPVATPPPAAETINSTDSGIWTINGRTICLLAPLEVLPMQSCADGEVCAAVSLSVIIAAKLPKTVKAGDVGICSQPPNGELQLPKYAVVPPPRLFYPLTRDLNSFPLPLLSGNASGAYLAEGGPFGHAVLCRRAEAATVRLDAVPYAAEGPFSVNFWFRAANVTGDSLQYMFSQAIAGGISPSGAGPDQVEIFFPEQLHPAFGVVRSAVADSSYNSPAFTFLDSDGYFTDNVGRTFRDPRADPRRPLAEQTYITDGLWHMATVTTQPNGTTGFRLYMDGDLAGEVAQGGPNTNLNGTMLPMSGGKPMAVPQTITLCSRFDNNPSRHYDGLLAYLSMYDIALSPEQVKVLFRTVMKDSTAPPEVTSSKLMTKSGKVCTFPNDIAGRPLWTSCQTVQGIEACPVSAGQWEACADRQQEAILEDVAPEVSTTTAEVEGPPPSLVLTQPPGPSEGMYPIGPAGPVTQDGHECQTPLTFRGTTVDGCLTFAAVPSTPLCWVEGPGPAAKGSWNVCKPSAEVGLRGISTAEAQTRVASTRQACVLPVVHEREIVTDCIFLDGSMSCPLVDGRWAKCASKVEAHQPRVPLVVPPYYQPNGFFVSNRTTIRGEACRLPLMVNGSVVTNCAGDGSYCVGMTSGEWQQCAPAPHEQRLTLQEIGDSEAGFPAKGAPGGFCIPSTAEALTGQPRGCEAGLACIPLPVRAPVTASGVVITANTANVGYCSPQMRGAAALIRAYRPVSSFKIPQPRAFFPLTGGNLYSVSLPALGGSATGISWEQDEKFESVLRCKKADRSQVVLPSTNFTLSGSWTLNLWFKRDPGQMDRDDVTNPGYLFSQLANQGASDNPMSPNQIVAYMPAKGSILAGVIRTLVKDSRDIPAMAQNSEAEVLLDTDGRVNANYSRPWNTTDINDGKWHMLTLSTQPFAFAGYRLFLDGKLVGELRGDSMSFETKQPVQVGGGAPILLNGPITLCSPSDSSADKSFDGSIAHLALFEMQLTADQIGALYDAYTSGQDPVAGSPISDSATPAAHPPKDGVEGVNALGGTQEAATAHSKSRSGAIAGGVIGAAAGAAIAGTIVFLALRRRRRKNFVPFKEGSMIFKSDEPSQANGQVELSKSIGIDQLEASGFAGRQKTAVPAFATIRKGKNDSSKSTKWEGQSSDEGEQPPAGAKPGRSPPPYEPRRAERRPQELDHCRSDADLLTEWSASQNNLPFIKKRGG